MKVGSAEFEYDDEHATPKNRLPFEDTVTTEVDAPKPLNVKPSGMAPLQVSSPSSSTCVHPERSLIENCMSKDATIVSDSPAGPCGPGGPAGP